MLIHTHCNSVCGSEWEHFTAGPYRRTSCFSFWRPYWPHLEIRSLVYFNCDARAVLSKNRPENNLWIDISASYQRVAAVSASVSAEYAKDMKKSSGAVFLWCALSLSLFVSLNKGKGKSRHQISKTAVSLLLVTQIVQISLLIIDSITKSIWYLLLN